LSSKYFFGKNYCNIVIRKLAKRCGFNEPNSWTVRSCQCLGIEQIHNSGANSRVVQDATRHSSNSAVVAANYQRDNRVGLNKRMFAGHYKGPMSCVDAESEGVRCFLFMWLYIVTIILIRFVVAVDSFLTGR